MTDDSKNQEMKKPDPLVSICVPTFNSERWIMECLTSALAQSYQPIELLVVDDASSDRTVELARSLKDERIRLYVNERNLGLVNNWNRCIELASGEYIKFLFHDDVLYPHCVQSMMRLFLAHENLGLVFAPRDILVEGDAEDEATQSWLQNYATLHTRFDVIEEANAGRELFAQYVRGSLRGNWLGEPSSIMVKKECFQRLGLFNPKLTQLCDLEMWLRIIYFYDVGFVREKLSAFRYHSASASSINQRSYSNWLDMLWLLESLSGFDEIRTQHPEIDKIRGLELLRSAKAMIWRPLKILRLLRTERTARQGLLLFPRWIWSALGYPFRRPSNSMRRAETNSRS